LWTDFGINKDGLQLPMANFVNEHPNPEEWKCRVFAGFDFKYQGQVKEGEYGKLSTHKEQVQKYMDIVTTSGPGTNHSAEIEKIKVIHSLLKEGQQMALASGVNFENVVPCLPYCDYFVVASSVET